MCPVALGNMLIQRLAGDEYLTFQVTYRRLPLKNITSEKGNHSASHNTLTLRCVDRSTIKVTCDAPFILVPSGRYIYPS